MGATDTQRVGQGLCHPSYSTQDSKGDVVQMAPSLRNLCLSNASSRSGNKHKSPTKTSKRSQAPPLPVSMRLRPQLQQSHRGTPEMGLLGPSPQGQDQVLQLITAYTWPRLPRYQYHSLLHSDSPKCVQSAINVLGGQSIPRSEPCSHKAFQFAEGFISVVLQRNKP